MAEAQKKRRGRPKKDDDEKIKAFVTVGVREHENDFFVEAAEALGFDSAASLARGLLYAVLENSPQAADVRRRLELTPPRDDKEIQLAREILKEIKKKRQGVGVKSWNRRDRSKRGTKTAGVSSARTRRPRPKRLASGA